MLRKLSFLILLAITGCDTSYGVYRTGVVSHIPEDACVLKTLEKNHAKDVTSTVMPQEKIWYAIEALKPEDKDIRPENIYQYTYYGIPGILRFYDEEENKRAKFDNKYVLLNQAPSKENVEKARSLMDNIEIGLDTNCGIKWKEYKETCLGVECEVHAAEQHN